MNIDIKSLLETELKTLIAKIFSDNMTKLRLLLGLSRKEFAKKIGVSTKTIWSYNGKVSAPSAETLVKASYSLHMSIDDLISLNIGKTGLLETDIKKTDTKQLIHLSKLISIELEERLKNEEKND